MPGSTGPFTVREVSKISGITLSPDGRYVYVVVNQSRSLDTERSVARPPKCHHHVSELWTYVYRPRGRAVTEHLLTPSKITAWLDCDHYLTLRKGVDAGLLEVEHTHLGDFARLLVEKGNQHELECLERYRAKGPPFMKCRLDSRESRSLTGWRGWAPRGRTGST